MGPFIQWWGVISGGESVLTHRAGGGGRGRAREGVQHLLSFMCEVDVVRWLLWRGRGFWASGGRLKSSLGRPFSNGATKRREDPKHTQAHIHPPPPPPFSRESKQSKDLFLRHCTCKRCICKPSSSGFSRVRHSYNAPAQAEPGRAAAAAAVC